MHVRGFQELITSKGTDKRKKSPKGRNGPGRPTLDDLQRRKERILDVANTFFIEHGYAATSLVDVAKHSGVATRTIYEHYGDKADVFKAVIDQRANVSHAVAPEVELDKDLFEILLSVARYICSVSFSKEGIPYQRLMIAESNRFPDLMQQVFQSLYTRFHATVAKVFETLGEAGAIPEQNHHDTATFFIDLVLGIAQLELAMNWKMDPPSESELQTKVTLFIAGRFGIYSEPEVAKKIGRKKVVASAPAATRKRTNTKS